MAPTTNFEYMRRSNRKPEEGDVFCLKMKGGPYIFGRAIIVEPDRATAPIPMSIMLYIYNLKGESSYIDIDRLNADDLLIPPAWTNRRGWTMCYFETIATRDLSKSDFARHHCFADSFAKVYRDERGEILAGRTEP